MAGRRVRCASPGRLREQGRAPAGEPSARGQTIRAVGGTAEPHVAPFLAPTVAWLLPTYRGRATRPQSDRKSTRLNSSHLVISYAVFCLKKKKTHNIVVRRRCGNLARADLHLILFLVRAGHAQSTRSHADGDRRTAHRGSECGQVPKGRR